MPPYLCGGIAFFKCFLVFDALVLAFFLVHIVPEIVALIDLALVVFHFLFALDSVPQRENGEHLVGKLLKRRLSYVTEVTEHLSRGEIRI